MSVGIACQAWVNKRFLFSDETGEHCMANAKSMITDPVTHTNWWLCGTHRNVARRRFELRLGVPAEWSAHR